MGSSFHRDYEICNQADEQKRIVYNRANVLPIDNMYMSDHSILMQKLVQTNQFNN